MQTRAVASHSLFDQCIQLFAETIAEQFHMPAPEALRQINRDLAANPLTRNFRLGLRDLTQELQVRPTDNQAVA